MATKATTQSKAGRPTEPLPQVTFSDAEVPTVVRQPNPFDGVVSELAKDWNTEADTSAKAKTASVPADQAKRVKGWIQRAADDAGKTARVVVSEPDKGGNVTLKFWLRSKITRPRKGEGK